MPLITTDGLRDQPDPSATLPEVSWAVAAGTADIITAVYDPVILAYTDGLIVGFRATAANSTTTPTFNANSLGARTIVKNGGEALVPGDIPNALAEVLVRYNLANTRWELLNPQGAVAGEEEAETPLPFIGTAAAPNLHLSNSGSDATNDTVCSAGRVRSDDDATNLRLAAAITKQLDVAWAAGTNAGGCDASTKGNNETWHHFLIAKVDIVPLQVSRTSNVATINFGAAHGLGAGTTIMVRGISDEFDTTFLGAVLSSVTATTVSWANTGDDVSAFTISGTPTVDAYDVLASQSATAPTMPSGWTKKQALGAFTSDSSAVLRPMLQNGPWFEYKSPPLGTSNAETSTAASRTITGAPNGIKALLRLALYGTDAASRIVYVSDPDGTDSAPSESASPLASMRINATANIVEKHVRTDTSRQVRVRADGNVTAVRMAPLGWFDPRRAYF